MSNSVQIVGPFTPEYRAVVDGYQVPDITLSPVDNDETHMNVCIHGHCVYASLDEIERWMPFVANAMAIASGFTCHGENSQPSNPFKTQLLEITVVNGD